MAKRQPRTAPKPSTPPVAPAAPDLEGLRSTNLLELEQYALEKIESARTENSGQQEWKVFVTRVEGPERKSSGREARLFDCSLDELEGVPDLLKAEYGDGLYRIRVRLDGRNFQQWDVEIELSPSERLAFRSRQVPSTAPVVVAPAQPTLSGGGDMAAMLAEVMRQNSEMMRLVMERPAAPAVDPMATFASVAAAFKGFQELMPKNEAKTGLEMFEKGMEFMEKAVELRGGDSGGGEGGIAAMVREFLQSDAAKIVAERLTSPITQQPNQQRPQGPFQQVQHFQPTPRPDAPAVAAEQPAPAQQPIALDQVERAIDYLIGQAEQGVQPELFSDTALQMVPASLLDELEQTEDMIGLLVARYPKIATQQLWFEALLGAMFVNEEPAVQDAANTQSPKPAAAAS